MTRRAHASSWRACMPHPFRRSPDKIIAIFTKFEPRFARRFAPLVLLAVISTVGCRLDMLVQPRYNPLAKSDFFPDQRSSRSRGEGTVARGDERTDTYFYTGKIGNNGGG